MADMDPLADYWPSLDETIRPACDTCADMGQALRCADNGRWCTMRCPDCGQREDTMTDTKPINPIAPEPNPTQGEECVHDRLRHEYGNSHGEVLDDLWAKALAAQTKYGLEQPGLYTFNGRNALRDAYQEILDAIAYLAQYEMENPYTARYTTSITGMVILAQRMRYQLKSEGSAG